LVAASAVDIERSDSPRTRIGRLYVHDDNGRLQIRGRLKKRHAGRGRIPGHLHIEVLANGGAVLAEGVVRYYRPSAKSGVSDFSREFGVRPEDVRTVRVIHHVREESGIDDGASQNPESVEGPLVAGLPSAKGLTSLATLKVVRHSSPG